MDLLDVRRSGVILALDVTDRERGLEIAEAASPHIDAVKTGYPLILSAGLDVLSELKRLGKPVIADLKVADVPHVSAGICRLAVEAGADYVIVQGFLGRDVVEACSEVARVFVVADMSHPGAEDYLSGHSREIAEHARGFAAGIVAPATRPQTIKTLRPIVGDLPIISPGVKAQGAAVGSALSAGADFEIVGRAIYNAPEPDKAAEEIAARIKELNVL
ncbi:MAG: orotidine-5'-phosphate decarboxylase [Methanobacteriota archaeon]|nr:MAG: orotidine-5'-phosphate decarboxylase [Euryarchaeota archaeon]